MMPLSEYLKCLVTQSAAICSMPQTTRKDTLVTLEYDKGLWRQSLSQIENANSLEDFLFPRDNNLLLRRIGNYSAKFITYEEYLRAKANLLANIFLAKEDICEIGCGQGWNLMALRWLGYDGNLSGVDISKNGINVIEIANRRWNLDIQTRVGDMRQEEVFLQTPIASSSNLFTFLALEQLPIDTYVVLQNFVRFANEKSIILLESSRELFPLHYSEILSRIYTSKRDYLRTLQSLLKKRGIVYQVERIRFSHRIGNEIAAWYLGDNS
jgi:SAM-dependent methyltransferase